MEFFLFGGLRILILSLLSLYNYTQFDDPEKDLNGENQLQKTGIKAPMDVACVVKISQTYVGCIQFYHLLQLPDSCWPESNISLSIDT